MNFDLFTPKNDIIQAFYTQPNLYSVLIGVTESHWSTTHCCENLLSKFY